MQEHDQSVAKAVACHYQFTIQGSFPNKLGFLSAHFVYPSCLSRALFLCLAFFFLVLGELSSSSSMPSSWPGLALVPPSVFATDPSVGPTEVNASNTMLALQH